MKKLRTLPIILYPYLYLFWIVLVILGDALTVNETLAIILMGVALLLPVICNLYSFGMAIYLLITACLGKRSAGDLAKLNVLVKLVQIPAYLFHFFIGVAGLVMSVWGIPFLLWAILIDLVTISLSGIIEVAAAVATKKEGSITTARAVLFSVFGFTYCIDVFASIVLFLTVRKAKRSTAA